jgi:hypothetical protein
MKLSKVDREALQRALEMARAQSEQERAHIDRVLAEDGWQQAAETAAYHCQDARLHLKPWQPPPCWISNLAGNLAAGDDGVGGRYAAAKLVQRLLAAGLSRFEPNPIAALEAAETRNNAAFSIPRLTP